MPADTRSDTIWSLATVKSALGVTVSTEDARLIRIADGVSALLERETNRWYVARARTEVQDGPGGRVMFLQRFPVVTFTSVTVLRYPSDAATEVLDPTRYNVNKQTGRVWAHNDILNRGNGNITFVYTPGYGAKDDSGVGGILADAWDVGLGIVRFLFDEERTGAKGATQVHVGNQTYIVKPDWPLYIKLGLKNLKAPAI